MRSSSLARRRAGHACVIAASLLFAWVAATGAACGGLVVPDPARAVDDTRPDAGTTSEGDTDVLDVNPGLPPDFGPPPWIEPDAGPMPAMKCSMGGGKDAGNPCPLPKSVCVNDSWLVTYEGGKCVAGMCQFKRLFHNCYCKNGKCPRPPIPV